jgi:prepilin signal peptidase PulO-like enzyme (type II secretory pathway)
VVFGFLLGVSGGFLAVMFGFWIATIFVFLKILFTGKILSGKTQIPFGPFLCLGLYTVFILGLTVNNLVFRFI